MADPKEAPVSPYPKASVARVLDPHAGKLGATLVARQLGHLAVKVTFHKQPLYNLEVKFYATADDGAKAAQVGATFKTDRTGVARLDHLVDAGLYVCEIENQTTPAVVPTVSDPAKPYVVPTPVDRPYFDFDEACEFDDVTRTVVDFEGVGDGEAFVEDDASPGTMTVALAIKSGDALEGEYPRLTLEATDGSYRRSVSAKDAMVDKGGWRQVVFRGLVPDASYRLTKDHDEEYSQVIFDGEPYDAIIDQKHEAGDALADHKFHGFESGPPAEVAWT